MGLGFVDLIRKSLLSPKEAFNEIEPSLKSSLIYYVILSLIFSGLLSVLMGIGRGIFFMFLPFPLLAGITSLIIFGLVIMFLIIAFFIGSAILFISSKILGIDAKFDQVTTALALSSTPAFIFGWIPFIGTIAGLYGLYILLVGLSELYKIEMSKAFIIVLVGVAISIVVSIIGYIFIFPILLRLLTL